jgi:DNA processing protein
MTGACAACLRRTWLLRELGGHLEPVRREIAELLLLEDEDLIAAVGGRERGRLARELLALDPTRLEREAEEAGLAMICRCDPAYPARLHDLPNPPAVLHVAGGLDRFLRTAASDPVAIVGSRRGSAYGVGVARSLARGLSAAKVPVISGMAAGIDTAAHEGALSADTGDAATIAVLRARRASHIRARPGPSIAG